MAYRGLIDSEACCGKILKARIDGTFEPEKIMLTEGNPEVSNREEMLYEFQGQQPVVVMKRCNDRGAKGHSFYEPMFA